MWTKKITDIYEFKREVDLCENSGTQPYSTKIRWNTNSTNYKIDLSKIKEKSTFLCEDTYNGIKLPKDCDYILFNPTLKKVFLIELKSNTRTSTPKEIEQQLLSGERWWNHLSFCMGKDDECKAYEIYKLVIYVNQKKPNGLIKLEKPSSSYSFMRGYGKNILLAI